MSYKIKLTDEEMGVLADSVNHGYFPAETYSGLSMTEESQNLAEKMEDYGTRGDNFKFHEFDYEISEHEAWAITAQREDDPASLFACIGGNLLEKLIALENSIV